MMIFVWSAEKAGRAHSSRLPLGGKPREAAQVTAGRWPVFSELRGVLQQVLVFSVSHSVSSYLTPSPGEGAWRRLHCVRERLGSLRLTTQSL